MVLIELICSQILPFWNLINSYSGDVKLDRKTPKYHGNHISTKQCYSYFTITLTKYN